MSITYSNQEYKIHVGLKQNLAKYPESKILREIVQNAEDSGASEVIIKLDTNTYNKNTLFFDDDKIDRNNIASLQGPSLIIYNNGVFAEKDWVGVKFIGVGSKKQDIKSIGNFGLGFNSVYHITDVPQIVSDELCWFLDPLNLIGGGPKINFVKDQNAHKLYSDQFEPFKQFGCDFKTKFNGTIIRIPLRMESSELRKTPLTLSSIEEILEEFSQEIPFIPIFLKRISSIVLMKDDHIVSSVKIKNHSVIKKERELVARYLEELVDVRMKDSNDIIEFTKLLCKQSNSITSSYRMDLDITIGNSEIKNIAYAISSGLYVPPNENGKLHLLDMVSNNDTKIVPYGGVCIPLYNNNIDILKFKGRPFCFLPIGSLEFNIPCHINGFFLLSDARNDIKFSSSTNRKESQEYRAYEWNQYIVHTISPYFYAQGLEFMKTLNFTNDLYKYFPYRRYGSKIEQELSKSVMDLIISGGDKQVYKFFKHNVSNTYSLLDNGVVVRKETPNAVINYFTNQDIIFYQPPTSLIDYLNDQKVKYHLYSSVLLCKFLKNPDYQLEEYDKEILSLLVNSNESRDELDSIPLIPIIIINDNQEEEQHLYSLKKTYKNGDDFLLLPNSMKSYSLLFKFLNDYQLVAKYSGKLINPSLISESFKDQSILKSLQSTYRNLFEFNLTEFLLILKNIKNQTFDQDDINLIWDCLLNQDSLNGNWSKLLTLEMIETLNIIPISKNNNSGDVVIEYTNLKSNQILSSILSSELQLLEPLLNKLNIYLIQKDHKCNSLFTNPPYQKLLSYLTSIGSSLESKLTSTQIYQLRNYISDSLDREIIGVGSSGKNKFISPFFNLHIHPSIGNNSNGKQFINIDSTSVCVEWDKIDRYIINGMVLIKVNDLSKKLISNLPTNCKLLKDEETTYIEYLIPNIQKFSLDLSIEIIKSFCARFIKDFYNNDKAHLKYRKWIPNIHGNYEFPSCYYILNEIEKKLLIDSKPEIILHPSLIQYEKELTLVGVKVKFPVQEIVHKVPFTIYKTNNTQLFMDFMDYLKDNNHLFNTQYQYINNNNINNNNNNDNSETKLVSKNKYQKSIAQLPTNNTTNQLNNVINLEKILDIKFIPSILVDSYEGFMPNENFISPNNATIIGNKNSMFSVKHAIEIDVQNPLYRYISKDDPRSIIRHWKYLLSLDNKTIELINKSINFNEVFNSIYKSISKLIQKEGTSGGGGGGDNFNNKPQQQQQQQKQIKEFNWENELKPIKNIGKVWIFNSFISVNSLSLSNTFNFEPYIFSINNKYPHYKDLFYYIGVQDTLQLANYQLLLNNIFYENSTIGSASTGILSYKVIEMCTEAINSIGKLVDAEIKRSNSQRQKENQNQNPPKLQLRSNSNNSILIPHLPTSDNRLVDFKQVLYSDQTDLTPSIMKKGCYKLHDTVSNIAVNVLNIRREQQVLQRGNNTSIKIRGFGQKEKLIDRLRSIIIDYKSNSYLNEVIQNSSDAMASKVEMFFDKNKYESEFTDKEFCVDFNDLLQQALVVYNNSVFSDQDIENIQNMTGTTKRFETSKIGRYGIGSCSQYNFTNCPSILSGKYLMIFDPMESHLESSDKYEPGLQIEISDHNSLVDLFKPFYQYQKHFNFDLDSGYFNGTIFRLPLRAPDRDRNRPNIVDLPWDFEKIYDLFNMFISNNIQNQLLFTNVEEIKFGILNERDNRDESSYTTIFHVKKLDKFYFIGQHQYQHNISGFPIEVYQENFEINDGNKTEVVNYLVGKALDTNNPEQYKHIDAYKFVTMYNNNSNKEKDKRKVAGGVAFKIIKDQEHLSKPHSKSFCYLPYKDISIPVNVHASFSVSTTREILESNKSSNNKDFSDPLKVMLDNNIQNQESFLFAWNNILMRSIVAPIYLDTLMIFKQFYVLPNQNDLNYKFYYSLWPSKELNPTTIFDNLSHEFYRIVDNIITKSNLFLPVSQEFANDKPNLPTYYVDKEEIVIDTGVIETVNLAGETIKVNNSGKLNFSVIKCLSLFCNISSLPRLHFKFIKSKSFELLNKHLSSRIINKKQLPIEIVKNQDLVNIFNYIKNDKVEKIPTDLIGCQLLLLADGNREFLGENSAIVFNKDFIHLYPQVFEFVDEHLSLEMKDMNPIHLKSVLKIENLKFNQFFFEFLLGNFNKYDSNHITEILEHLRDHLDEFNQGDIQRLKTENIIPFKVNNNFNVVQFRSVSNLYDFKFKENGLILDYPPSQFYENSENNGIVNYSVLNNINNNFATAKTTIKSNNNNNSNGCGNSWDHFFKTLGIKESLNANDFSKQFKQASNDFYNLKLDESPEYIMRRIRYLWKAVSPEVVSEIWETIIGLNIVPTKPCSIDGSKQRLPLLSSINECVNETEQKLCFSSSYISDVHIAFPEKVLPFGIEKVLDNFVYLIESITENHRAHNIEKYSMLYEVCSKLNEHHSKFQVSAEIKERIKSIPNEDTNSSIPLSNMVFDCSLPITSPFFNILPHKFNKFHYLFHKFGVQKLTPQNIIKRFTECQSSNLQLSDTHQRVANSIYNLLNKDYLQTIQSVDFPILTESGSFKPRSQVVNFNSSSLEQRINTKSGVIYKVNHHIIDYEKFGIENLSDKITELVNSDLSDFNYETAIGNDPVSKIITNHKTNPDYIKLLDRLFGANSETKEKIMNMTVFSGKLHTKIIFNHQDITLKSNTDYFYEESANRLYLNYALNKSDVLNKLHMHVLHLSASIAEELDNFDRNDEDDEDDDILDSLGSWTINCTTSPIGSLSNSTFNSKGDFKFRPGLASNSSTLLKISKSIYQVAVHDLNVANVLYNANLYDDSAIYCYQVIEKSIKAILVSQGISFDSKYRLTYLKSLVNSTSLSEQLPFLPDALHIDSYPVLLKFEKSVISKLVASQLLALSASYLSIAK